MRARKPPSAASNRRLLIGKVSYWKGQYRIVSEMFLFAVGLSIAIFVTITFNDLRDSISETATRDQLISISNLISASLIKSMTENTTIRLQIPDTISDEVYIISFETTAGDTCTIGDCILRITTIDSKVTITQQLFNISQSHIINGNIYSSAKYIEIISHGNRITVDRA